MYDDDLVLISLSIRDLQSMLNICAKELRDVGLSVNCTKTFCMRVGPKHSVEPNNIIFNSVQIPWVQEFTYLGLTIVSAKHFKINLQNKKQNFFRSLNAIFSHIGSKASPDVILSLIEYCVPILLYGIECIDLSKSLSNSIENAYSQAYSKIFRSFDRQIIKECQYNFGYLPMELKIVNRRLGFLSKLKSIGNLHCNLFTFGNEELTTLISKYNINLGINVNKICQRALAKCNWKWHITQYFEKQFHIN